jgi:hypothetical protein
MSPVTIDLIFTLVVSSCLVVAGMMALALLPGGPEEVALAAQSWRRVGGKLLQLVLPASPKPEHKTQVIYVHLRDKHTTSIPIALLNESRESA